MGRLVRWLAICAASIGLLSSASACSLVSCLGDGIELNRDFVLSIKHDGKPLGGVAIKIETNAPNSPVAFQTATDAKGTATISLSPGNYWLNAEYLGIGAAYHCFHVAAHSSIRAKRKLAYNWGDLAPSMRRIAGVVTDSQPGTGGTLLWNLSHPVTVPIRGVILQLQNAISGASFSAESNDQGHFAFGEAPDGTYVLHVTPGSSDRGFDTGDFVVKVSQTATRHDVTLKREQSGCGGTVIFPQWN